MKEKQGWQRKLSEKSLSEMLVKNSSPVVPLPLLPLLE
jgi:hypothetical protein